jgi:predicted nucleic acid-binding protein
MPDVECFVDTNVLLYAVSTLPVETQKAVIARNLLDSENWSWSAQVAAEFISVSTSPKRNSRLSFAEAEMWIDTWLAFPIAHIEGRTIKEALRIVAQSRIAYYDAQIIAAAKQLGCKRLYSEDLNDGQDYGGVKVVNPFGQRNVEP